MNRELFYIKRIHIQKVRHLENIDIEVTSNTNAMRHLILTGKNGSGKTSLLEALRGNLQAVTTTGDPHDAEENIRIYKKDLKSAKDRNAPQNEIYDIEKKIQYYQERLASARQGLDVNYSIQPESVRSEFEEGNFILAYFGATRSFISAEPQHVEKVTLKKHYEISENTSDRFLAYLLDLKVTQAMAIAKGDGDKADEIKIWFDRLQEILRDLYDDPSLMILFNEDTFKFSIQQTDHELFDFNTASDGFSAILDIIVDLMLRMQRQENRVTEYLMPGIVLIDEIENHLHLELQRKVLRILEKLFPNIQFIVTTHSPFILNSIQNATIYDLEKHILIKEGLSNASYSGIVEGYHGELIYGSG